MATDPRTLGNQPAVPHHQVEESETYSRTYAQHHGITKRELFAGMAMQGLCTNVTARDPEQDIGRLAVDIADALLAALVEGA